jgi:hypothetical protein
MACMVGRRASTIRFHPLPRKRDPRAPAQGYARRRLVVRVYLPMESAGLFRWCFAGRTR